jgi:hypothetical protein
MAQSRQEKETKTTLNGSVAIQPSTSPNPWNTGPHRHRQRDNQRYHDKARPVIQGACTPTRKTYGPRAGEDTHQTSISASRCATRATNWEIAHTAGGPPKRRPTHNKKDSGEALRIARSARQRAAITSPDKTEIPTAKKNAADRNPKQPTPHNFFRGNGKGARSQPLSPTHRGRRELARSTPETRVGTGLPTPRTARTTVSH